MAAPFFANGDHAMNWPANAPSIDDLATLSPQAVDDLDLPILAGLQAEIDAASRRLREARQRLDAGLERRYGARAAALRRAAGKDTGTVRFDDGGFTVVADLPKKVDWDQDRLARIVERIRAAGDDPAQYVDIAIRVPERKYEAWPDAIRAGFEPARTVRTGALKVDLLPQGGTE